MKKAFCFVCLAAIVAGCAKQPGEISPVAMGDVYSNVSCNHAVQLYNKEAAKVPALVASQKQAVTGDAVGVFLLGVPVSSLSGADLEGEIGATKGKLVALSAKLDTCGKPHTPITWG
ncbi:hypothetical protein [Sedimentitalea sp.]|uniref:hypothetical protein n=1 Tax=Sedimentitalea sp. TaxID=2048915 RepID=UPI0032996706